MEYFFIFGGMCGILNIILHWKKKKPLDIPTNIGCIAVFIIWILYQVEALIK